MNHRFRSGSFRIKKIKEQNLRDGYSIGNMDLNTLIAMAKANGASDLHLEPGLPAAIRVRGTLRASGAPIPGKTLLDAAQELIGNEGWNDFLQRQSYDLSRS